MTDGAFKAANDRSIALIDLNDLKSGRTLPPEGVDVIVRCQDEPPEAILEAVSKYRVSHFIQQNDVTDIDAVGTSKIILHNREKFFAKPLASIFAPELVDLKDESEFLEFNHIFSKSSEKNPILDQLSIYLSSFSGRRTLNSDVLLVADELFTNAVYNAPFVENCTSQKSGASRKKTDVSMGDDRNGRIFAGKHENLLVLGCEDPYGTLNLQGLLNRILKCYQVGAEEVIEKDSDGGAGIGSYLVFNATSNFFALVEQGKRTLICCAFVFGSRDTRRKVLPKSLHLYGYDRNDSIS